MLSTKPPLVLFQHIGIYRTHSHMIVAYKTYQTQDVSERRAKKRTILPIHMTNTRYFSKEQIEEQKRWIQGNELT